MGADNVRARTANGGAISELQTLSPLRIIIPSAEGITLGGKAFPSYVALTADGALAAGLDGDLYVGLQVHVPERLSDRQRRLFEQLKASRSTGPAAESGLQTGDIILEIAGHAVNTPADVRKILDEAHTRSKRAVLLRIKRDDAMSFVAVPIA